MITTGSADSAVAVMCWDSGGRRLVGMMIVRRRDAHACFVELPPDLEIRLAHLDLKFVEENAGQLMAIAYASLLDCDFEQDRVMSRDFLDQGYRPAVPGTLRHIPAEPVTDDPPGVLTWRNAGFIVDIGEIDLHQVRQQRTYH